MKQANDHSIFICMKEKTVEAVNMKFKIVESTNRIKDSFLIEYSKLIRKVAGDVGLRVSPYVLSEGNHVTCSISYSGVDPDDSC